MSIKTVNDVITRTLQGAAPKVIAIKGTWGCGKTHVWQNLIADLRGECHHQNYSYVSLFGITSISQLRVAIFAGSQGITALDKRIDALQDNSIKSILGCWKWLKAMGGKLYRAIFDLPYGKSVAAGIEVVLPAFQKNMVICLDDFERSGKDLKVDELLGLISELKEQRNCQVVLIFNDEKLATDQKKTYQEYREKAIDIELVYAPTVNEAIQIALPMGLPCRDQLALHISKLQIRNIRILFKIVELVRLLTPVLVPYGEAVLNQMSQTLVLFTWMEYGDSVDGERPGLDFYRYWRNEIWYLHSHQKDHQFTESESRWDKLFSDYGIQDLDDFDRSIYQVIQNGHIEESQIKELAGSLNQRWAQAEERERFLQSWDRLTDSFDDNEEEAIRGFIDAMRQRISLIGANELDWAMGFLRQFGMDGEANELLEAFIIAHQQEAKWFNLDAYKSVGELTDPMLRTRFQEAYDEAVIRDRPSLLEVIRQIVEEGIYSDKAQQFVKEANQEQFYDFFKAIRGPKLKEIVNHCLAYSAAHAPDTTSPAKQALQRIAGESGLNAYRVKQFIKLEA